MTLIQSHLSAFLIDYEESNKNLSRDLEESRRRELEAQQRAEEYKREALESKNRSDELQRSADEMQELISEMKRSTDDLKKSVSTLSSEKGKTSAALVELQKEREAWMREKDEMRAFNIVLKEEVENNQSTIRRLHQELLSAKEDAIRRYKESEEYADDLADESLGVYVNGFKECQGKVQEFFPDFDTVRLVCSISEPIVEEPDVDVLIAPTAEEPYVEESTFERDVGEVRGETSADGERTLIDIKKEAVAMSSGTEEIETIHLDDSSSDQAEEDLAEETIPNTSVEEAIPQTIPASSGSNTMPTTEGNPSDELSEV